METTVFKSRRAGIVVDDIFIQSRGAKLFAVKREEQADKNSLNALCEIFPIEFIKENQLSHRLMQASLQFSCFIWAWFAKLLWLDRTTVILLGAYV